MSSDTFPAFVTEKLASIEQLLDRIETLDESHARFQTERELLLDHLKTDVDVFQEQPHLLDGKLRPLISKLTDCVLRHAKTSKVKVDLAFAAAYLLTKARGFKIVFRHLPHEVQHMAPVMSLLSSQDPKDSSNWETKYMLLLWLAILCLIPMDLKCFDGPDVDVPLSLRFVLMLSPPLTHSSLVFYL